MNNSPTTIALEDRIRLVRVQAFFRNAAGGQASSVISAGLSSLVLALTGVSLVSLVLWFCAIAATSLVIFLFERRVGRIGLRQENFERLFALRMALGCTNAVLFGLSIAFLPGQAASIAYLFVFIIMASMVALVYMAFATMVVYGLVLNALTLLPYAVFSFYQYFALHDSFLLLMGTIAVVWQAVFIGKALQLSRLAVREIEVQERLRVEMEERGRAEAALRASQVESQQLASLLRMMCDNVPDMIWAKDLQGRYLFANQALCERILGTSDTQAPLGKTYDEFARYERDAHPDEPEWHTYGQYSQDVDRHTLEREEPTVFEESGSVKGRTVFLDVHQARFVDAQGKVIGTVGSARDITERKASEAFVQHLAHHDVLTDLPNRALLNDRLSQSLAQIRRDRAKLAVLFIDLDRLKPVNDSFGHGVGDLLLIEVASRLRSVLARRGDTVARLGGDEFVVLLPRINRQEDAVLIAERVLYALSQPFYIDGHTIAISASIGIALSPRDGDDAEVLIKRADQAMYCAKNAGRNGFRFYASQE